MKKLAALFSLASVIGCFSTHAQVTTVNWDPLATGTANGGGAGTWSFTSAQWFNGTSDVTWDNAGNYRAVFGGAAGGNAQIAAGLIVVADSLVFNTAGYNITGGGTRRVTLMSGIIEANADATITTAITNPGAATSLVGITKTGAGRLTFAAANNTFLGGLRVLGGTVVLDDKQKIGGADQSITLNGGGLELTTVQGVSGRTLFIGDNGGTIHLPGVADQWSFNDLQGTNGSLTKTGLGTLVMTGPGTNGASRAGATIINEGILRVDTTEASGLGAGPVTVNANGTLAGSGIVGGAVTIIGTLSPGTSPGTLTLQNDLSLTALAQLNLDLDTPDVAGGGINDLIIVLGDLTLDGTLNVTGLANFGVGTYELIDYAGTLLDNGLDLGALAGTANNSFDYDLLAGGGKVNLVVTLVPEPGVYLIGLLGAAIMFALRRGGGSTTI